MFLTHGYIVAGVLIGIGAAWYGGVFGFIVAYAAFSIASVWLCFSKEFVSEREKQSAGRR